MKTLNEILEYRSKQDSKKIAFRFLENGEVVAKTITYKGLYSRARIIGSDLLEKFNPGDRALLLFPSGIEFIEAYFGCLLAGIIAIPVYPPAGKRKMDRLVNIIADSSSKIILTTRSVLERNQKWFSENLEMKNLSYIVTDALKKEKNIKLPIIDQDKIAFLQYTSGSTDSPKGVIISHKNLIENLKVLTKAYGNNKDTICIGWLPVYHDMGLIGNILSQVFVGGTYVFMSPVSFVQKPIRWLAAISKYKGTYSGAPNFAYDLCYKAIKEDNLKNIDLSSWKKAFNGAEPIKETTLNDFSDKFGPFGFNKDALFPGYGLAEATLMVSGRTDNKKEISTTLNKNLFLQGKIEETTAKSLWKNKFHTVVACGLPLDGFDVRIVNPNTKKECQPNSIGEIWLAGPSIGQGYWNKPELTKKTFQVKLLSSDINKGFLRTGDMGFLKNNQLYLTGRLKEMIIINGQNYFPQDIERTVQESSSSFRQNSGTVFSTEIEGDEKLMVAQEIKRTELNKIIPSKLIQIIRNKVSLAHDLSVYEIVLLKPATIPKTSSGKIQRSLLKKRYLENSLTGSIYNWRSNKTERYETNVSEDQLLAYNDKNALADIIKALLIDILGISEEPIHNDMSFFDLGISSLEGIRLFASIGQKLKMNIPSHLVYEYNTINLLSDYLFELGCSNGVGSENTINFKFALNKNLAEESSISGEKEHTSPLSSMQKRILFITELVPRKDLYNIYVELNYIGNLCITTFKTVLNNIIERHESLRSTIVYQEDKPLMHITTNKIVNIPFYDISTEDIKQKEKTFSRLRYRAQHHEFDFSKPALRLKILKFEKSYYKILLTQHHLFTDGWSTTLLLNEIVKAYKAVNNKEPNPFNPLFKSYSEFSKNELAMSKSRNFEVSRKFWKQKLQHLPKVDLPTDRLYPSKRTYEGDFIKFDFTPEETNTIKSFAREQGVSLNTLLISVFSILLFRHSNQADIPIAVVNVNRDSSDMDVIGFYANTVIQRFDLSNNQSFHSFLQGTHKNIIENLKHQGFPYNEVVNSILSARTGFDDHLYNVSFAMEDFDFLGSIADLDSKWSANSQKLDGSVVGTAKDDLSLIMAIKGTQLVGNMSFNTDVFDRSTIESLASRFRNLMFSGIKNKTEKISSLQILPKEEQQKLLVDFVNAHIGFPRDKTIVELFEIQAKKFPNKTAVTLGEDHITYKQLHEESNRFAHYIINKGVIQETVVAICLEHSIEMIISTIAVLKAGGTYLPLEPSYPNDRISYCIKNAGASFIIRDITSSPDLDLDGIIAIDFERDSINKEPATKVNVPLTPNNLAYIIYTSGSTGNPKGVSITHSNVISLFFSDQPLFDFNNRDVWSMFHSFCFDFSVWEMFGALLFGGKLVMVPRSIAKDTVEFCKLLRHEKVTILNLTPTAFSVMEESLHDLDAKLSIRYLIFGGEKLDFRKLKSWKSLYPECKVINGYGVTETTVFATQKEVTDAMLKIGRSIIGKPFPTVNCYVIDKKGNLAPIGVFGELYIGGPGVSRGYINQEKLTKERFVPNPFQKGSGKLYRTGDIVRWNTDGDLEFSGREDNQIKIRGFRVEIDEIRKVLEDHKAIESAVVTTNNEQGKEKSIVAYYVPNIKLCQTIHNYLKHRNSRVAQSTKLFEISDGLMLYGSNNSELEFLAKSIFNQKLCFDHNIIIPEDGVIFDIGANIGAFSIYCSLLSSKAKIYAFEPIPPTFEILKLNADLYSSNIQLFNYGLSNQEKTEKFVYHSSISYDLDEPGNSEKDLLNQSLFYSAIKVSSRDDKDSDSNYNLNEYQVQLKTISSVVEEKSIQKIDLLKINVAGLELDVLNGILNTDWRIIHQVVLVVYNELDDNLHIIKALLKSKQFKVHTEKLNKKISYVYAISKNFPKKNIVGAAQKISSSNHYHSINKVEKEIRNYLKSKLPDYMIPSFFVALPDFPINTSGKLDMTSLPSVESAPFVESPDFVEPEGEFEKTLAKIWVQILRTATISKKDDFFSLGGNSIKVMQLANKYHRLFRVRIPLVNLFSESTFESHIKLIKKSQEKNLSFIPKLNKENSYNLSPSQLRLWLFDKLNPESTAYNMYGTLNLNIPNIDIDAFNRTINILIGRHEMLRTIFVEENGRPKQKVLSVEKLSYQIELLNYSIELEIGLAQHCFDLKTWPLFKIVLVQKGNENIVLCNMHHIIGDGWSIEVLKHEILTIYNSRPNWNHKLPKLTVQYKDYSHWQLNLMTSNLLTEQKSYWKSKLNGALPVLSLPKDYPLNTDFRTPKKDRYYNFYLQEELYFKIKQFTLKKKVSAFAFLIACFKVLLYRLTGEKDLIIGTPMANRNMEEVKDLIGFFVNTIMLRDNIDKDEPFQEFLKKVNITLVEGINNQSFPFENILEGINMARDNSTFPISSIFLIMSDFNSSYVERINDFTPKHGEILTEAKFDLEFTFKSFENGLSVQCIYNGKQFEKKTIAYWAENFKLIMNHVISRPYLNINEIEVFTSQIKKKPISLSDNSGVLFDVPTTNDSIVSKFENQVREFPNNIAIIQNDEHISYSALNEKANAFARRIVKKIGKNNNAIGLLIEHGANAVLGMLAVLKSGNFYVPLSPDYPQLKLENMVIDCNCCLILETSATTNLSQQILKKFNHISRINISNIPKQNNENLNLDIDISNPAYLLYTSGSTGKPKGIIQNHAGVLHYIRTYSNNLGITNKDKLSFLSNYIFDSAVQDVYGALLNGATLVTYSIQDFGISGLPEFIEKKRITIFHSVPTVYRYFIRELEFEIFKSVRVVALGGERVDREDFISFKKHFSKDSYFVNEYGATEATLVSQNILSFDSEIIGQSISLGIPVNDTTVYLLNDEDEEVGVYQHGEIVYGSNYLANGYFKDEELTKKAFTINPITKTGMVYRSGDLGRKLPTGEIEFVGRKDYQVKFNGLRIHPSEIEQNLKNYCEAENAIVQIIDNSHEQLLVAFLTVTNQTINSEVIKAKLRKVMPTYMIPNLVITLTEFPLTPTGKINRLALFDLLEKSQLNKRKYLPPKNNIEKKLVQIWKEILKKDHIGILDDFFELGGNSLNAIQLSSRINTIFKVSIPIKDIFKNSKIECLAKEIKVNEWIELSKEKNGMDNREEIEL